MKRRSFLADGLARLTEYAAAAVLNVIVENHGGLSSDGDPDACNFGALTTPHISAGTGTIAPSVLSPELVAGGDVSATVGSMRSMVGGPASVPLPIHGATLEGLVQLVP